MISVTTNLKVIVQAKLDQIRALKENPDAILRTVALAVLPEMKNRIHIEGKDSAGGQIGTYSNSYMAVRTGNYLNSKKTKTGEFKTKKGKGEAGKFTKGTNTKIFGTIVEETPKAGGNRPVYNRTADTKVIASLTRQMENDMTVLPSGRNYGIGYNNAENKKKSEYVEATYDKKIFTKLTKEERELSVKTAQDFLPEYLNNL